MFHSKPRELIFERSIAKTAGMLTGAVLMTGLSYYFITRGILDVAFEARLLGLFFGPIAFVINAMSLFRGGPQVVFDEQGINDLRTSWGLISWNDVLSFATVRFYSSRHLCIYLADEPGRIASLSLWGRRLGLNAHHATGFPAFMIRFHGLTPGFDEAWNYLQTHHPEKVRVLPTAQPLGIARP